MANNDKSLSSRLKKMMASQLNIKEDKLADHARIIEDLGADSLDIVEMFMTLEEEFELTIPDENVVELKTVIDVINYIENELKKREN